MPTPAERRALLFLAGLMVLGAGVRASAALHQPPPPTAAELGAIDRQIQAVDSARARPRGKGRKRRRDSSAPHPAPRIRKGTGVSQGDAGAPSHPLRPSVSAAVLPTRPIDLDVAPAAEIDRLPRIGPSLAARIVANRDSLGPFGSLEALRRVRGVGAAVLKAVAPYVTFSLQPRPSGVDDRTGGVSARKPRGHSRRIRPP